MARTTFWKATEVAEIARELKEEFHPHLKELPLICVFRSKYAKSKGRPLLGKAKRLSGLNAYLAFRHFTDEEEEDYPPFALIIEIAHDLWLPLDPAQKVALVDHELCHFTEDGGTVGHDLEEFRQIVERHGLWLPNIEEFVRSAIDGQAMLFENAEKTVPPAVRKAIENLRPKKGSGIDEIEFSTPGGKTVRLEPN